MIISDICKVTSVFFCYSRNIAHITFTKLCATKLKNQNDMQTRGTNLMVDENPTPKKQGLLEGYYNLVRNPCLPN